MTPLFYTGIYQDTIPVQPQADTSALPVPVAAPQEAATGLVDSAAGRLVVSVTAKRTEAIPGVVLKQEVPEAVVMVPAPEPMQERWNTSGNFFSENGLSGLVNGISRQPSQNGLHAVTSTAKPAEINPWKRELRQHDWLLGIFLLLVVLFVWIRIFYSKFFATLGNALISFHAAARLFLERNVLLHRVSVVLDFIYLIVLSVFVFEMIDYTGFASGEMTGFRLFLLLFNIIVLYTLFRLVALRLTGDLFLARTLFSEYTHNTFVINKGVGIVLFPVIIMIQYLPYNLVPVILVTGAVVFITGILWKAVRAYQIIIRREVFIFYLILYLCTLEFLPLLLGYKFVTTLIQSY